MKLERVEIYVMPGYIDCCLGTAKGLLSLTSKAFLRVFVPSWLALCLQVSRLQFLGEGDELVELGLRGAAGNDFKRLLHAGFVR